MSTIASDHPLTRDQQQALKILAGLMIPASTEYQVPGADDDLIFADILRTVIPEYTVAKLVVGHLNDLVAGIFSDASNG